MNAEGWNVWNQFLLSSVLVCLAPNKGLQSDAGSPFYQTPSRGEREDFPPPLFDMVPSLRQLQEKSIEQSLPLYGIILDLTKAFRHGEPLELVQHTRPAGLPRNATFHSCSFPREHESGSQFDTSRSATFQFAEGPNSVVPWSPSTGGGTGGPHGPRPPHF